MNNRITASIEFYFRGKRHAPCVEIDLDSILERQSTLPSLHDIIAAANGIDTYSHEYDVMIMEDVHISDAKGCASNHIHNGKLDISGFEKQWHELQRKKIVQTIADKHLDIGNLEKHVAIQHALLEAYKCGESAGLSRTHLAADKI